MEKESRYPSSSSTNDVLSSHLGPETEPFHWTDSNTPTRRNSSRSAESRQNGVNESTATGLGQEAQLSAKTRLRPKYDLEPESASHCSMINPYDKKRPKLLIRQRLHHFTWAWYTMPMSTGGLSLLIRNQLKTFDSLETIGFIFYFFNLALFTAISITMLLRFWIHKGDFVRSITHPREGFFVPTFFLSFATIITSTERYWIPNDDGVLSWAIQGTFWAYVFLSLIIAVGQYSYIFTVHSFGLQTMMPTWILPIFPIMLSGTIASVIAKTQPEISILPVLGAGLTCQGLGLSVAMLMYAHMIGRLMQSGLPNREHRTGLFMCVGPPSFTALALIGMAKSLERSPVAKEGILLDMVVLYNIAIISAVFLWALSFWWFGIAVIAVAQAPPKHFHLGWWACVFPNTGFTLATISMAKEFGNEVLIWMTTAMSIIMVCTYFLVLICQVHAVLVQDIMYPGRDEDVEDH
ncbi:hypothetical protein NQ176_g4392 [Zarea fungicola]|uniref:Uncharacterized protein n=1 Tax=Zarea fungicola TaxID=93591 RepID=A0ACC1NGA8_9HYPO|nr:hypothetical protein NQ176_g4392 [Lecanicillium fungicola]